MPGSGLNGITRLLGRLEQFQSQSEKRFDALEAKVDLLNQFKWRMAGGAALLGVIVATVSTVIVELWRH